MTLLRHIHLGSLPHATPPRFPTYALATEVQTELQQRLHQWKKNESADRGPPPPPTLLSFTPAPTYTRGRRETDPLLPSEEERLQLPLRLQYLWQISNRDGYPRGVSKGDWYPQNDWMLRPTYTHAPRGGLTTYHGPGQVVFWPVIDLHSPLHGKRLTVRGYASMLEQTTIAALASLPLPSNSEYGAIHGFTTENPGVWVRGRRTSYSPTSLGAVGVQRGDLEVEHKIAALGVHLSRFVTGLGVAVNVGMPTSHHGGTRGGSGSGDDETVNPWARIDPCGLADKGVTSVAAQFGLELISNHAPARDGLLYKALIAAWARGFAARLGLHGVESEEVGPPQEQKCRGLSPPRVWAQGSDLRSLENIGLSYVTAERWQRKSFWKRSGV